VASGIFYRSACLLLVLSTFNRATLVRRRRFFYPSTATLISVHWSIILCSLPYCFISAKIHLNFHCIIFVSIDHQKTTKQSKMADDDPVEYEKKLLSVYPLIDNKPLPHTIRIPVSQRVKSIKTRDELTTMPSCKDSPGPFSVGDLLWVKMSGYPHWPAMISRDPETGQFSRSSETVGFTYHVQYFGEATRGWTQPGKFWRFEGPQLIIANRNVLPKQKKKQYEEAISEAVQAHKMEPAARVKKLTFNYLLTDPKSSMVPKAAKVTKTPTARKRKTPSKSKSSANDESIYDFDETVDEIEQGDKPELVWSRPREPTPPLEPSPPRRSCVGDETNDKEIEREPCFICKSDEGDSVKCCHKDCGKYYHLACLNPNSYPTNIKSGNTLTCPLHYCLTCYTDQPTPRDLNCLKPTKRQLLQCVNCPTAFHNDDACTAAGTVVLSGNYIMCPAHRSTKNEKHINVSWCFSCNEGGKLICCESCPAAFHDDCIDNPPTNDEQYFCYDCQSRKQLKYGDIIWIKLGAYRWWPAKISHPNSVPENIMKLSHTKGDFPVYFFGSHDYYWSHRGRVFAFVEDDGQLKGKSSSSDKKFKVAVQEARQQYLERKAREEERKEKLKSMEKPRFRLLKQNKPINDVAQSSQDDIKMSSKQRCECKPDGDVLCGTDECLNRLMMLECDPSTCPVKEKCKNQRFRKRQYPVCVPFRTENVGWGLRTTQDIKKGDFVIEYVGELIDEAECNRRMEEKMDRGDTTFYFLTIDKERIIDAGPAANHARFMNHSCQPNCETQKWVVNGQTKVGLFAICDIPAGSELTFNYNLDCRGNEMMQCRCNSENCSGFIGLPVKNGRKPNNSNNNNSNHNTNNSTTNTNNSTNSNNNNNNNSNSNATSTSE